MIIEVSEPAGCAIICSLAVAGELEPLTLISLQFTVYSLSPDCSLSVLDITSRYLQSSGVSNWKMLNVAVHCLSVIVPSHLSLLRAGTIPDNDRATRRQVC